jgi:hypothetical protein
VRKIKQSPSSKSSKTKLYWFQISLANLFSENNRERLIEEIENTKRGIKNTASGYCSFLEGMKMEPTEFLLHLSPYPKMLILGEKTRLCPMKKPKTKLKIPKSN